MKQRHIHSWKPRMKTTCKSIPCLADIWLTLGSDPALYVPRVGAMCCCFWYRGGSWEENCASCKNYLKRKKKYNFFYISQISHKEIIYKATRTFLFSFKTNFHHISQSPLAFISLEFIYFIYYFLFSIYHEFYFHCT